MKKEIKELIKLVVFIIGFVVIFLIFVELDKKYCNYVMNADISNYAKHILIERQGR